MIMNILVVIDVYDGFYDKMMISAFINPTCLGVCSKETHGANSTLSRTDVDLQHQLLYDDQDCHDHQHHHCHIMIISHHLNHHRQATSVKPLQSSEPRK